MTRAVQTAQLYKVTGEATERTLSITVDGAARWAFFMKRSVHAHSFNPPAFGGRRDLVQCARLNADRRKTASPRVHGPQQGIAWTKACLAGNVHM
jgi:hypothetical protein